MGRTQQRTPLFLLFLILAIWIQAKQKGRGCPRPEKHHDQLAAIVIVVIPIAIGMPAATVFVPPAMSLPPTAFPRFMQFVASMFRLAAIPAVMFRSFVQPVIRLGDSSLTTIVVLVGCPECSPTSQHPYKRATTA